MRDLSSIKEVILFNQIVYRLKKEFGELPESGIVAGQAVATAIYELLSFKQKGKYNDIDIFINDSELPDKLRSKKKHRVSLDKFSTGGKASVNYVSSYSVEAGNIRQTGYTINFVAYDKDNPRFNYIGFYSHDITSKYNNLGNIIISSFDINCCQVAINLKDKTVSWTKEFQDFLYSKELKSAYLGTPMHTAIRLLKKKSEMPLFKLDIKNEMKILQTSREFMRRMEELKPDPDYRFFPGNLFSDTYLHRFNKYKCVLNEFFKINEKIIKLSKLESQFDMQIELEKTIEIKEIEKEFDQRKFLLVKRYWVANPTSYCKETVESMMKSHGQKNKTIDKAISLIRNIYDAYNSSSKKSLKRKETIDMINNSFPSSFGRDILLHEAHGNIDSNLHAQSKEAISRFIKFSNKHPRIMVSMQEHSLNEIFQIVKVGNWLDKNMMSFIIGEEENKYQPELSMWLEPNFKEIAKERFNNMKNSLLRKTTLPLFQEIEEKLSNETTEITEITDGFRLFTEGEKQRHCVGGYWDSIESGRYSIFSIKTLNENQDQNNKGLTSTLCIDLNSIKINQHYGAGNTKVSKSHKEIGLSILNKIKYLYENVRHYSVDENSSDIFQFIKLNNDRRLLFCKKISFLRKTRIKRRFKNKEKKLKGIYRKEHLKWLKMRKKSPVDISFDSDIPF